MKKLNFVLIAVVLTSAIAFTTSCSKKKGCTDSTSTNYDADAKDDNGSCTYEGSVQFWYNKATSESLVADGSTSLIIYVDGAVVGSYATSVYFTGDPDCGQSNVVTSTKNLGNVKTKTLPYIVKDDLGDEIWSGNVTYDATKTCFSLQLIY